MLARFVTWLLLVLTLAAPGVCCCSLAAAVDAVASCVNASSPPPKCPGCVGRRTAVRAAVAAIGCPSPASAQGASPDAGGRPAVGGETTCGCRCHAVASAVAPRSDRHDDREEAPIGPPTANLCVYDAPADDASYGRLAGRPPSPAPAGGRELLCRLQRLLI